MVVSFAPVEIIIFYLMILFGVGLGGVVALALKFKTDAVGPIMIWMGVLLTVAWTGTVVRGVYYVHNARPITPWYLLGMAMVIAYGVYLSFGLIGDTGVGTPARKALASLVLGVLVAGIIIPLAWTGGYHAMYTPLDPSTLPDDGLVRDPVFQNATVAKFGWYFFSFFAFIVLAVIATAAMGRNGVYLSFGLFWAYFFFIWFVLLVNVFDVVGAAVREWMGQPFKLPEFKFPDIGDLFDPGSWFNWDPSNIEIPEIEPVIEFPEPDPIELPEWWPFPVAQLLVAALQVGWVQVCRAKVDMCVLPMAETEACVLSVACVR